MQKFKQLVLLTLVLTLITSVGLAQASTNAPYDDAAGYIQAVEDAMDARYGSRDAWPQGFSTVLALAKYYSGVTPTYESDTSWASTALQSLEQKAVADKTNAAAAFELLEALREELKPADKLGHSWPYEAKALIYAAYLYSGNPEAFGTSALPTDNDITEETAIGIAKKAIQEQYDLSDEEIDKLGVYTFYCPELYWNDLPFWGVIIGLRDTGFELYYVYMTSTTGEIIIATRNDGNG